MTFTLPKSVVPVKYWLRAESGEIFRSLNGMARSGNYSSEVLGQIRESRNLRKERELRYYLASLYLLIDQIESANELLESLKAGEEMKRYYALLNHCRKFALPMPSLNHRQEQALLNIDGRLRVGSSLAHRIEQAGGFSIVGNAPMSQPLSARDDLCTFYFNDYRKNPAIDSIASVHVVTPSWRDFSVVESDALLLSGNNILFRRSRVWERFDQVGCVAAIYTAPRALWASLTVTLGASPTAGLLVLNWVNDLLHTDDLTGKKLEGHVEGFSCVKPHTNHVYNNEKLSSTHNWDLEPQLAESLVYSLRSVSAG